MKIRTSILTLFILSGYLLPFSAHAAIPTPISCWNFDESSGNASDALGLTTLTNNGTATYSAGKINNAVNLVSASSQYMSGTNGGHYNVTSGTISGWIKITSAGIANYIMSTDVNSGTQGFDFRINSSRNLQFWFGAANVTLQGGTALSTGTWYMATVTWTPSGKTLYVNAVSDGSDATAQTMGNGDANIFVGNGTSNTDKYWNGSIDATCFWSSALSQADITSLYNGGAGEQYPFATAVIKIPNLISWSWGGWSL